MRNDNLTRSPGYGLQTSPSESQDFHSKKRYRSALRSRRLIMEAYINLMQEKPAEKITVKDIVDRADLNRSTFYVHFKSVDDVQNAIYDNVSDKLITFLSETNCDCILKDPLPLLLRLAEFVESDLELYRRLVNIDRSGAFMERIQALVTDKMMTDVETLPYIKDHTSFLVNLRFFMGGYVALLKDWCAGRLEQPFSEISAQAARTIALCIEAYMKTEGGR